MKEFSLEDQIYILFEKYESNETIDFVSFSDCIDELCHYHCIDKQSKRAIFDLSRLDENNKMNEQEFMRVMSILGSVTFITNRKLFEIIFHLIDVDNSGTLDFDEFKRMHNIFLGYDSDESIKIVFDTIDIDGNETIEMDEFLKFFVDNDEKQLADKCKKDENGLISFIEFKDAFKSVVNSCYIENATDIIFDIIDEDGDNKITVEECLRTLSIVNQMNIINTKIFKALLFLIIDKDDSNGIDEIEFRYLCKALDLKEFNNNLFDDFEKEIDEIIQFEEFIEWFDIFDEIKLYGIFENVKMGETIDEQQFIDNYFELFNEERNELIEYRLKVIFTLSDIDENNVMDEDEYFEAMKSIYRMNLYDDETFYAIVFQFLDTHSSKELDKISFRFLCYILDIHEDIEIIMKEIDESNDGKIQLNEYLDYFVPERVENRICELFDKNNKDGKIDIYSFEYCFYLFVTKCTIDGVSKLFFDAADIDRNGYLDKIEFLNVLKTINNKEIKTEEQLHSLIDKIICLYYKERNEKIDTIENNNYEESIQIIDTTCFKENEKIN